MVSRATVRSGRAAGLLKAKMVPTRARVPLGRQRDRPSNVPLRHRLTSLARGSRNVARPPHKTKRVRLTPEDLGVPSGPVASRVW